MTRQCLLLISLIVLFGVKAHAEDPPPAFRPGAPPPFDPAGDFDDMEDELMEMGDDGFRPPPPPPPPGSVSSGGTQTQQPAAGFDHGAGPSMPAGGGNFGGSGGKQALKFKLVEGEFWEKGKKRPRGKRASSK